MAVTAIIDRFEGELAVLIEDSEAGREGLKADAERALLPDGARAMDMISLSCSLGEGDQETVHRALRGARLGRQAAEERSERVKSRIERLKKRGDQDRNER